MGFTQARKFALLFRDISVAKPSGIKSSAALVAQSQRAAGKQLGCSAVQPVLANKFQNRSGDQFVALLMVFNPLTNGGG